MRIIRMEKKQKEDSDCIRNAIRDVLLEVLGFHLSGHNKNHLVLTRSYN